MRLHAKGRIGVITAVALGVIGGSGLAPTAASAAPLRASAVAVATPDAVIYYCEENLCMGNEHAGKNANPDIVMHADEYNFYGHFELQTPNHKTYNSPMDATHQVGTNYNYAFGEVAGAGKYCGTAWDGSDGNYEKIGYICETFSAL